MLRWRNESLFISENGRMGLDGLSVFCLERGMPITMDWANWKALQS